MEDEVVEPDTPCSSIAADSVFRVGIAGAIWGSCIGPVDANRLGLTGIFCGKLKINPCRKCRYSVDNFFGLIWFEFVYCNWLQAKTMGKMSFQCGLFAGIFNLTRCGIQNYRGRSDMMNAAAAGAIAGGLVAAAARTTRSKKQVLEMAALLSVLGVATDYSRTF